jgi:tetratricopeptide (TPR) repeat protein
LDDCLTDPSGQGCLDFEESVDEAIVSLSQPSTTADEWFEMGCDHEDAERLEEAVEAYRQALLIGGPNSTICFNLANVFYRLEKKEQAAERYYQAVELDRGFAAAWNNLGIVLGDLGSQKDAVVAFEHALSQNPGYADAHYNLADLLDQMGDEPAADAHWRCYIAKDQKSAWARHARKRLAAMGH